MPTEACDTCGVDLTGDRCYNADCEDRHPLVDEVLGGDLGEAE